MRGKRKSNSFRCRQPSGVGCLAMMPAQPQKYCEMRGFIRKKRPAATKRQHRIVGRQVMLRVIAFPVPSRYATRKKSRRQKRCGLAMFPRTEQAHVADLRPHGHLVPLIVGYVGDAVFGGVAAARSQVKAEQCQVGFRLGP